MNSQIISTTIYKFWHHLKIKIDNDKFDIFDEYFRYMGTYCKSPSIRIKKYTERLFYIRVCMNYIQRPYNKIILCFDTVEEKGRKELKNHQFIFLTLKPFKSINLILSIEYERNKYTKKNILCFNSHVGIMLKPNDELADFSLKSGTYTVKVHKDLLMSISSRYFELISKNSAINEHIFEENKCHLLNTLVSFMYSQYFISPSDKETLEFAEQMGAVEFVNSIIASIVDEINDDTAINIYKMHYNSKNITAEVIKYLKTNKYVIELYPWSKNDVCIFNKIIKEILF